MSHIFVSYNRKNGQYAHALADALRDNGFDVWIDDHIFYGEEWWKQIVKAIKSCGAFTVIMTPDSEESKWVQREVLFADDINKPCFPLLLSGQNWPLFLGTQYIDVSGGRLPPEDFYNRLGLHANRSMHTGAVITQKKGLADTGIINFTDVQASIRSFYRAYQTRDWKAAQSWLIRIKVSGEDPHPFEPDYYEPIIREQLEYEKKVQHEREEAAMQERQRHDKYEIIRVMAKHEDPARVLEALHSFWEQYGEYDPDNLSAHYRPQEQHRLIKCIIDENTSSYDRADVGRRLAKLGDPRSGIVVPNSGVPVIDWVKISNGRFTYQQRKKVDLPTFYISRYPVTYSQYEAFVEADGYQNDDFWTEAGRGWRGQKTHPEKYWQDPDWHIPNHPVIGITWFEAVAFCRWFSLQLGFEVRLPSEQEWEKAARGTDGRTYPWGSKYETGCANVADEQAQRTVAVGLYPHRASPYGVMDMSGNVWEWCATDYENPNSDTLEGQSKRVLRGGSWNDEANYARATVRLWGFPFSGDFSDGFRMCTFGPQKTQVAS